MSRDFIVPGPCMVYVKGEDKPGSGLRQRKELGLSEGPIQVSLNIRHKKIMASDYGSEVPAEMLWMLVDATIQMSLVHYDVNVLDDCIKASMAGSSPSSLNGAGIPMGGNVDNLDEGCHYISLNLYPVGTPTAVVISPYRFFSSFLTGSFGAIPLGTERSVIPLTWQAIPYKALPIPSDGSVPELTSANAILYDRSLDSPPA